jgi:hypothetical protein
MKAHEAAALLLVLAAAADGVAAERPSPLVRPLPHRFAASSDAVDGARPDLELAPGKTQDIAAPTGMCANRSTGGPDPFGYTFIDSTEPGGPVFDWVELSGVGTQVLFSSVFGYEGPFAIGFPFSFYGQSRSDFFIQTCGAVNFSDHRVRQSNACPLPDTGWSNEFIGIRWDAHDPLDTDDPAWYESFGAGACPYDGYPGACLVVEYEDFCIYPGGPNCASAGTFELILLDDDRIIMQYLDAGDEPGFGSTTGIQSAGGLFSLTYACDLAWTLTANLAIRFERTPPSDPVVLAARDEETEICPRTIAEYSFTVLNNTGSTTGFDILYSGFDWNVSGEATIGPLNDGEGAVFTMTHRPPEGANLDDWDDGTVTVRSQALPVSASVDVTSSVARFVVSNGPSAPDPKMDAAVQVRDPTSWHSRLYGVAGYGNLHPVPPGGGPVGSPGLPTIGAVSPEATTNVFLFHDFDYQRWSRHASDDLPIPFPNDHASGLNVSGEAIAVAFPDTTGLSDLLLHIYNLSDDRWDRAPLPAGFPPQGIWAHDIACNDATNTCYITGGASSPGGGDLATTYAYDVAANSVTPLPPFTSPRAHHASLLLGGLLCIAGGIDASNTALSSTQCYDVAAGSWHPENADLGPLPGTLWGMADAVMEIDGALRPVMAGGILEGGPPGTHFVWHDAVTWQYESPFELGVYRAGADAFGSELYLVGGSIDSFTPVNALQRLHWCATEAPANDECQSAVELPLDEDVLVTNEATTGSGPPLPSCGDYQGGDVWGRVTVAEGEWVLIHTSPIDASAVRDTGMSVYAECPHQAELECNDDVSHYDPHSQVGPLAGPGTYWVRVWEKGNDAFGEFYVTASWWIPVELVSFTVE